MVKNNNWRKTAEVRRPASIAAADSTLAIVTTDNSTLATVTTDTKVKQLLCTISNFLLFSAIPARSLEMSPSATFLFFACSAAQFSILSFSGLFLLSSVA